MSLIGRLKPGTEVMVKTTEIDGKKGTVRFVGFLQGKKDEFIGVELEDPLGKNNGDYNGKYYFNIEKKDDKAKFGVFVKSKALTLLNGTAVDDLLKLPMPKAEPKQETKHQPKQQGKHDKGDKTKRVTQQSNKNRLMTEIVDSQSLQFQLLKEQYEEMAKKLTEFEARESQKQIQELKTKLKESEDKNQALKLEIQKVRYSAGTGAQQEDKLKELNQKIAFFQSQKDFAEKQKAELKKKITRLEEEFDAQEEKDEMIEKLTTKCQMWEEKCDKLRQDLETANAKIRNSEMLGGGGKGDGPSGEQLRENIKTLNEMVILLESDLAEEREKTVQLQTENESLSGKVSEMIKLQRRLKSKQEEINMMKAELQLNADAATFAQKATFSLIEKEQQLKEKTLKLQQYIKKVQQLQSEAAEAKEMIDLQAEELETQEQQLQKQLQEKGEIQNQITMLNGQLNKYKQKIRELSQNKEMSISMMEEVDSSMLHQTFLASADNYQHKYFDLQKTTQELLQKSLQADVQSSIIRNTVGVYMLNLVQALPESYTTKFYPQIVHLLIKIKSANDKLYLLFEAATSMMQNKTDIYSKQNSALAEWLVIVMDHIPVLYGLLCKIELAFTNGDSQEQVSDILAHYVLKQEVARIDTFANELLQRIGQGNIDVDIDMSAFIEPVENLDKICLQIKRLPAESSTRLELCTQSMQTIHKIFESIKIYKDLSEAHETALIDTLIDNFLKLLLGYLRECCINPHIRLKNQMKSYLNGLDLVVKILKEIELNDTVQQLNNLYSETEDIKLLKETIMTTQFHAKELLSDLGNITYPHELSKIQVKLVGKIWIDRIKLIRDELNRFEQTVVEKNDLEKALAEQKKKILMLEKEIKDRQTTKQIHQKRIGQLQLRIEQATFIEAEYKQQIEKIRSMEQASKVIEEQLQLQSRKKKDLEDELKKARDKSDSYQTEAALKKKEVSHLISSDEAANLSIFKAVVKECNQLREINLRKKIICLKNSQILNAAKNSKEDRTAIEVQTLRRNLLNQICEAKVICDSKPASQVKTVDKRSSTRKSALEELSFFQFQKKPVQKCKRYDFGQIRLGPCGQDAIVVDQNYTCIKGM